MLPDNISHKLDLKSELQFIEKLSICISFPDILTNTFAVYNVSNKKLHASQK